MAPQILLHFQQPNCGTKLLPNYIINVTYLDRHERLDESLFVHRFQVDKKKVQDLASMIVPLLGRRHNSVRQSPANKAESFDGGRGNCVVGGWRILVSGSPLGHVNNGHDERVPWQTSVRDVLDKKQNQMVEGMRQQD